MVNREKKKNKRINKVFKWVGLALLVVILAGAAGIWWSLYLADGNEKVAGASDEEHKGLYVDGTKLKNVDGTDAYRTG